MGSSSNVAELARKLANAGNTIEQASTKGLLAGGQVVKLAALAELAAAGAGSGRMRGVGRKGGRIGVSYDIQRATGGEAAVHIAMKGAAHLLERDTKPHTIQSKKRTGGGIKLADGNVRRSVHHPGTRGKHPWEKALNKSLPLVGKTIHARLAVELHKVFAG